MKNKGVSLVEMIGVIALFFLTSFFIVSSYATKINREISRAQKLKIISVMEYLQEKSVQEQVVNNIEFLLDEKKILFLGKEIYLDNRFTYESKNQSNNFSRRINEKGILDIGFSILIRDKKGRKYQEFSYNTTNGLNLAILNDKK